MRLILSDIDGTILPFGDKVVSDRTREAFHAALDAGIHIGPASGRALMGVLPAFGGDRRCVRTALATNGMEVFLDGELIHREYLPREALEHTVEALSARPDAGMICFDGPRVYLVAGRRELLANSFSLYARDPLPCDGIPGFDVVKANIFCPVEMGATQELFEYMRSEVPELDFNLPVAGFLNITPKGYSKATGVDIICEALGIGIDEAVVFGDAGNDLEMIAHVPNSVAVANATDEVRAAARWHVGDCKDEAVQDAIFALAQGAFPFAE